VNFAQGEFVMLGGMLEYFFLLKGMPLGVSLLISVLCVAVLAYAVYFIFISNSKNKDPLAFIILTIGVSMVLRGLSMIIFGKNAYPVKNFLPFSSITIAGFEFSSQYAVILAAVVVIAFFLVYFFMFTLKGKVMNAASINPTAVELFGINVESLKAFSFFLSGLIGAIGGALVAPVSFVKYNYGLMFGLKGFAASVVGGFGNNIGAIAGGIVIGLSESLSAGYISSAYKDLVAFAVMLFVLFVKPSGLFGSKDVERV